MAKVISKYAETVMLRSVNRLINKYGHAVTLKQERGGLLTANTAGKATFGRFKVAFASGNLIINNNYKVRLRADDFPYTIQPLDKIEVNGAELSVVTARKISPDGANTIVWECECSGGTIPADGNSAEQPTILSPANNTSFYPGVSESGGLYSASFTASSFVILFGDTEYVSTEWQIAEDELFATIVDSGTGTTTWVSGTTLTNPMKYYVRARHNGTLGVVTEWSDPSLFSLGKISVGPVVDIVTPSLTTPGGYLTNDSTYFREYDPDASGFVYKAAVYMSEFNSPTGKTFDHIHWVITNTATNAVVWEGNSRGGYDVDITYMFDYNQCFMPWKEYDYTGWTIKGKYVATDATESEYCTPVNYYMN